MFYSLLTTHYSLLTTHYSLLTTHYSCQKLREIVGDVVDVVFLRRVAFPDFREGRLEIARHHENRGHAQRLRHGQVAGEVLEHHRIVAGDGVQFGELLVRLARRLGIEAG